MKQYEKYKPSGIEWLGEIPEHWEVKRVKDAAQICNGKSQIDVYTDDETRYPIYGSGGIMGYATDFIYKKASLLLGRKGTIDKPIYVVNPFWTIDTMFYTKINDKSIFNKFFYYSSLIFPFKALSTNTALPSMTQQSLSLCQMCFPPLSEQTAIANYLDTKTAAIDRKIELLAAKADKYKALRRSLINETVCRGLPASEGFTPSETLTKMKNSGIEWIGMIPEHWEVKRVKDIFRNTGSGTTPPSGDQTYYDDNGFNWLQTGDLNDGFITETSKKISLKAVTEFSTLKKYPKNSLVIAMYGATIGKMGYLNIDTTTNQACCVLTNPIGNNSQYLFYQLLSMKQFIMSLSTGGGQPNINQDIVRFLKLCIPPLDEQIAITNYLDSKTTQIDTILTNISEQIVKLSQLRKTLINDVVTGKIKVTE